MTFSVLGAMSGGNAILAASKLRIGASGGRLSSAVLKIVASCCSLAVRTATVFGLVTAEGGRCCRRGFSHHRRRSRGYFFPAIVIRRGRAAQRD